MSDAEDSCVLQNGDEATGCQPLPVVNCAQQPNVRLCDICRLRASLYTFKCCTWRCCGPDCYAVHCKTNLERDAKAVETAATVEVGKCAPCGGPSHAPLGVLSKRRATRQNVQQERSCSNDDDAIVLTEKQKKSLEHDPKLSKWFDALTLRRAVRSITSAPSPTERLAELLYDEEFSVFISDLMDVLDNGQEETKKLCIST